MALTAEQLERYETVKELHDGAGKNGLVDACVMQAVDWVYRDADHFTDTPECTPPSLRKFAIALNDAHWPSDAARTEALKPLIPLLVDADPSPAAEQARAWLFADFAVREAEPMAFDALYAQTKNEVCRKQAAKLRAVAKIVDADTARAANKVSRAAAAYAADYAADAYAADAADAAAYAADAAAYAADYAAAYAAEAAAYAADAAARLPILTRAAEVLRAACEIGIDRWA